jgi:hypothetical protein
MYHNRLTSVIKVESFLYDRSQFTDALSFLSENILGTGGTHNDVRAMRSSTHFHTSITVLSELTGEKLVEFSIEASVSDELLLRRQLGSVGHHLETDLGV